MPIYVNSVGRVKSSTELPVIKLVPCCSNLLLLVLAIVMGLFIVLVCARSLLVLVVCSRHRTYACGMSKSSLDTVCSYCKLEFRQTSVRKFIRHMRNIHADVLASQSAYENGQISRNSGPEKVLVSISMTLIRSVLAYCAITFQVAHYPKYTTEICL